MIEAYPLYWPEGRQRTDKFYREHSRFKSTFARSRDDLLGEVEKLRGKWHQLADPILSTNVELRQDGLPCANQREPEDSGVAIYFKYKYKDKDMCFACDKYHKVWENMVAIRKTIEAIRGIERWGSSDMMERAFKGFQSLPDNSTRTWYQILNVDEYDMHSVIERAYKYGRSQKHPDNGGSPAEFKTVQDAWQEYLNTEHLRHKDD